MMSKVRLFFISILFCMLALTACDESIMEADTTSAITESAQYVAESEVVTAVETVIEDYKEFIQSKSESANYSIYDIDKDGYPELFFEEVHAKEREAFCDIYTYNGGNFELLDRTYGPAFWYALPTYASYPNGNGIVEYGAVKGIEFVDVNTWENGERIRETVYRSDISEEGTKYYKDTDDDAFVHQDFNGEPLNHQYYQSETSCPYFEGSYLLGKSTKDNYTALYEAFGVETQDNEASTENDSDYENKNILTTYAESLDSYYGMSYLYTISSQDSYNSIGKVTSYDGFEAERILGYAVDDFDNNGASELLVLSTDDDLHIVFKMYVVNGTAVSMHASRIAVIDDDSYDEVTIPHSSSGRPEECAIISCFVEKSTKKIFLQMSDHGGAYADGYTTTILCARYADGSFYEMEGIDAVGSSISESYPEYDYDLQVMGVAHPNFEEIFESMLPLYTCFDDGLYEICHAVQRSVDFGRNENNHLDYVLSETVFSEREGLYTQ